MNRALKEAILSKILWNNKKWHTVICNDVKIIIISIETVIKWIIPIITDHDNFGALFKMFGIQIETYNFKSIGLIYIESNPFYKR